MSLKQIIAMVSLGCGLAFGIMMLVSIQTTLHIFEELGHLDFTSGPTAIITSVFVIVFLIMIILAVLIPAINLLITLVVKKDYVVEKKTTGAALWSASFLYFFELLFILYVLIELFVGYGGSDPNVFLDALAALFKDARFYVPLILIMVSGILWLVGNKVTNQVAKIILYSVGAAILVVMTFVFFGEAMKDAAGIIALILLTIQVLLVVFLAVMPVIGLDKQEEQKAE